MSLLTRRGWMVGAGCSVLAAATSGSSIVAAERRAGIAISGRAFGTHWRAVLPGGTDAAVVRAAFDHILASIDAVASPFLARSQIARFNAAKTTDFIAVSPAAAAIVAKSLEVAQLTGGAFEPTVGPLVHRFGFGPIAGGTPGSFTEIEMQRDAIRKRRPDLTLDLCGIAKGYTLDRMADALSDLGLNGFLIEFGGEISARGRQPGGQAWRIGVERPLPGRSLVQRVMYLENKCLATSGDLANAFEVAGRRYSHIVDPWTSRPIENPIASVSVISDTAMEADALATGLMVLGPDRGAALAGECNIPSLFLLRDGTGIRELAVGGIETHFLTEAG